MLDISPVLNKMYQLLESFKTQDPKLYELLGELMKKQYLHFPEAKPIYIVGDKVDKAMFISEGFITISALNKKKDPKILQILEQDEIKAGPDFMTNSPSEFLVEATAGTFVAFITFKQMEYVYQKFTSTRELATLIISEHNRKELRIKKKLAVKGIDKVEAFYELYPKMTIAGSVLTHEKIAGFLGMGVSSFIDHRNKLIASKRLILPNQGRKNS